MLCLWRVWTSGKRSKCNLINLNIDSVKLNILGLVVSLPQGLVLVSGGLRWSNMRA